MSAKFCKDTFNHNKKINLHGVTRKSGRGLPESVLQEEVSNKKDQEKVRGTVLAAELIGDTYRPSLIALSVYDTKPVRFLTMATERISGRRSTFYFRHEPPPESIYCNRTIDSPCFCDLIV